MAKPKPAGDQAEEKRKQDDRVDEEIAESFPASDPPSYAGGPQRIGGPRRPDHAAAVNHPAKPGAKR